MSEFENENHGDFVEPEPVEAEIVNTQTGLVTRPQSQSGLMTVADMEQQFALAVRQRELLSDYIKKQLQPGKHFYEIQGSKPSLTKEGAEIILLPHNLAPDYEIVSGPDAPPADGKPYQITVKCILRRKGDPNSFVGSGIGSAGSEKRDKHGNYNPRQYDKYLCHNATIKMAEKSAMIAATMNSTAASEFFTQDLDEVPTPPNSRTAERNASTCPAIGLFLNDDYRKLMSQLQGGNPRRATPQERTILLQRLQKGFPKEGISFAESTPDSVTMLRHKGGDLRIEGEHRLIGEGLLRVPGLVACMLLRSGSSQGSQTAKGRSDNRVSSKEGNADNIETNREGHMGHSGPGGAGREDHLPTKPARVATEATRAWMAKQLEPCMQDALQYFIEIGAILPTETIDDVPLRHVPTTKRDLLHLISMITQFSVDGKLPENETNVPHGKIEVPRDPTPTVPTDPDYDLTQYPFNITCPIPRKGMKRKEYLDNPDTIGSLFASRHGTDADSQADRQRLWGFINQWEPKTWVDRQGQTRMPSEEEIEFRKALDVLEDMMAKKGHKL